MNQNLIIESYAKKKMLRIAITKSSVFMQYTTSTLNILDYFFFNKEVVVNNEILTC